MQPPPATLLKRAARLTIEAGCQWQLPESIELSLLLTDDEKIQALNREFRGLDKPTDVLSFPLWEAQPPVGQGARSDASPDAPLLLGDIVISLETAAAQAAEYGHSMERETMFLLVHGLLHLLGYDHELGEQEEKRMFSLQEQIMRQLELLREE